MRSQVAGSKWYRRWLAILFLSAVLGLLLLLFLVDLVGPEPPAVAGAALLLVLATEVARRLAVGLRRFFWRVRYKLLVSYLVLALVPLLSFALVACMVGYLTFSHMLASLLSREMQALSVDLERVRGDALRHLAETDELSDLEAFEHLRTRSGWLGEHVGALKHRYPSLYAGLVVTDLDSGAEISLRPTDLRPDQGPLPAMPVWWEGESGTWLTVNQADRLELRSAGNGRRDRLSFYLLLSVPIDQSTLTTLSGAVGASLRTVNPGEALRRGQPYDPSREVEAGSEAADPEQEQATGLAALPVFGVRILDTLDWRSGQTRTAGRLLVAQSSLHGISALARRLAADHNALVLSVTGVFLLVFILLEAFSIGVGIYIARSITASVHELFVGTARIEAGELGYRIPVLTRDQLGDLARSFNRMARSVKRLVTETRERERLEEELRIGRQVQQRLLPLGSLDWEQLEVAALSQPSREVGGDYYDLIDLEEAGLAVLVADVSGKGTSAAFYMAELKGLMLALLRRRQGPAETLKELNLILRENLDRRSFVTMSLAHVDRSVSRMHLGRAGHCPVLRLAASGGPAQELLPRGLGLGLADPERFDGLLEELTLDLDPGDVYVFFTDGLTDALDAEGALYGDDRLRQVLEDNRKLSARELRDAVMASVRSFATGGDLQDDVTLIVMRVLDRIPS